MMQGPTMISRGERAKGPVMADSRVTNQEDAERGTVNHLHPSHRDFPNFSYIIPENSE